ncbi:protein TE18 [Testudinid alphaherpesvirus 3]|uniref:Protein TE18 n=1 Tax=Testudinid alphaherpesvirus 3 TaxID=2560801 RepID=A0A0K1R1B2_9ALPH|nr:protein TE18 [Testudinid alphaherpesvirus 3]AIU39331.1 protein TE18 [Testudinid alphaherpesvirus 3]AIU39426.1 protein TE18 [Testudinid alphaherpesvirus 3]AKI81701.1 protein TE18 [Testudinid alphaherpesvirus 3]AKV40732.1 hypothetical protein [Testudinid alphaherpesvirus 3]
MLLARVNLNDVAIEGWALLINVLKHSPCRSRELLSFTMSIKWIGEETKELTYEPMLPVEPQAYDHHTYDGLEFENEFPTPSSKFYFRKVIEDSEPDHTPAERNGHIIFYINYFSEAVAYANSEAVILSTRGVPQVRYLEDPRSQFQEYCLETYGRILKRALGDYSTQVKKKQDCVIKKCPRLNRTIGPIPDCLYELAKTDGYAGSYGELYDCHKCGDMFDVLHDSCCRMERMVLGALLQSPYATLSERSVGEFNNMLYELSLYFMAVTTLIEWAGDRLTALCLHHAAPMVPCPELDTSAGLLSMDDRLVRISLRYLAHCKRSNVSGLRNISASMYELIPLVVQQTFIRFKAGSIRESAYVQLVMTSHLYMARLVGHAGRIFNCLHRGLHTHDYDPGVDTECLVSFERLRQIYAPLTLIPTKRAWEWTLLKDNQCRYLQRVPDRVATEQKHMLEETRKWVGSQFIEELLVLDDQCREPIFKPYAATKFSTVFEQSEEIKDPVIKGRTFFGSFKMGGSKGKRRSVCK